MKNYIENLLVDILKKVTPASFTLPRFPKLGREPYETRFQGGTEIRGFNQIEKFMRHITAQNRLYCFSEKKNWGLGAL